MARLPRLVVPGLPHHATQRGNGGAQTFFGDADYALYRDLLAASCRAAAVEIWAWVLMPSHVHPILCPSDPTDCGTPCSGPPALCRPYPCAPPPQRPLLARALRRCGDG